MQRGQQRPLLVTGGTRGHRRAAMVGLLAGEGDEHLLLAVGAANASEPFLQIAALEKGGHRLLDDRPPVAIRRLIALVVDLLEGIKMFVKQAPQVRGLRIACAVERPRLEAGGGHGTNDAIYTCVQYLN